MAPVTSSDLDALRYAVEEGAPALLDVFDNFVAHAANWAAALNEIADEAADGEHYSANNHRAVAACTSIRSLALTALDANDATDAG